MKNNQAPTAASSARKKAGAALVAALFTVAGTLLSCHHAAPPRTELLLGTVCTVNAFRDGTVPLYDELFTRLAAIDGAFSATSATSQIHAVNEAGGVGTVAVSADVYAVTKAAVRFAALTDGAFNPAIGALVTLWGIHTDGERVPDADEIAAARALCDWRDIALDDAAHSIFLKKRGMKLDLGGIAKGFAADELAAILRTHKVRQAVISLGGNVYVVGKKRDGTSWQVGVKDPSHPEGEPALALSVGEASVVTSGVYERFFEQNGVRYHHILDTATGAPARSRLLSVTVVCPSSMEADALSTALFVLGAERGFALLRTLPQAQAVFIAEGGAVTASAALSCTPLREGYAEIRRR